MYHFFPPSPSHRMDDTAGIYRLGFYEVRPVKLREGDEVFTDEYQFRRLNPSKLTN